MKLENEKWPCNIPTYKIKNDAMSARIREKSITIPIELDPETWQMTKSQTGFMYIIEHTLFSDKKLSNKQVIELLKKTICTK